MTTYRIDCRPSPVSGWGCYDDNLTEREAWHVMQEKQAGRDDYATDEYRMVRVETTETVVDTIRALPVRKEVSP